MLSETPWETGTGAVRSPAGVRGPPRSGSKARWFIWLFGLAVLGIVVLAAAHFSEGRQFIAHLRHVQPRWVLVAALLQAATYLGQGQIWRTVARAGHVPVSLATAYRLSVARLFIDQALPSAGLSGTVVMVKSLEQQGIPMPVVMAGVVIDTASCYATYVVGLLAALVVSLVQHQATRLVLLVAVPFVPFALALTFGFIRQAGRPPGPLARRLSRFRFLQNGLRLLEQADPRLARSHRLIARAGVYQLAVILLDAATIWVLILGLGITPSAGGVYVSFMISTLTRLVGIAPGGLGTYEATSILTLSMVGVPVPIALSATLLFRGMSFWLPLLPGLWFSRRYMAPRRRRRAHGG